MHEIGRESWSRSTLQSLFVTHLQKNCVYGFYNVVQKVAGVQAPGLGVALALDVFLHHLVIEEPNAFSHVAEIASLAPNAEIEDQIHNTTRHRRGCRHGGVHFGEMRSDAHGTAPLHVIGKDLGVQSVDRAWGLDGGRQDVATHVPPVVAEKDEQMLGLVADRGILESEKVSQILARRVHHVGVFREAWREVGGVEHVEGLGHRGWIPAVQKLVPGLALCVLAVRHRHPNVSIGGFGTKGLEKAQTTKVSVPVGNATCH